jgi:hypothetical protein
MIKKKMREFGEKRIEKKTREKKRNKKSSRNKITERKLGEKETRKLTIYIYIYIYIYKTKPFLQPEIYHRNSHEFSSSFIKNSRRGPILFRSKLKHSSPPREPKNQL